MMRKMLLAAALSVTAMTAHADYQCSVTPRDDVIVSPQTVQVKGENGNLVITPDGNVMYNGKQYSLNAAQREQAKDYQAELRSTLPWIDEGAKSRVEKARIALDIGAEAVHFELHATQGLDTWGICSSPFLDHAFKTTAFRIRVDFHDDGSWSYEEDTVLQIRGRDEPFHHVDRNHLERVAEATPNPLARVKAG